MNKAVLLLAALTLCCCLTSLHGFSVQRCRCIRTVSTPVPIRAVKKIEVTPALGHCRRTEIIITRRNGSRVCVDPEAAWVSDLLRTLRRRDATSGSTTLPPTSINV